MSKFVIEKFEDFLEVRKDGITYAIYHCVDEEEFKEANEQAKEFIEMMERDL